VITKAALSRTTLYYIANSPSTWIPGRWFSDY